MNSRRRNKKLSYFRIGGSGGKRSLGKEEGVVQEILVEEDAREVEERFRVVVMHVQSTPEAVDCPTHLSLNPPEVA